jgi:hypothetical protein
VTRFSHEIVPTPAARAVVAAAGGLPRVLRVTTRFYSHFHRDAYLRQFLGGLQVPLETHASRLALYITETLTGDTTLWTRDMQTRPPHVIRLAGGQTSVVRSRAGAHYCAWHSVERPPQLVGRRFKLDDCRVWMRLFFLAAREEGVVFVAPPTSEQQPESTPAESESAFGSLLLKFIAHFIAVYEVTARAFTRHEAMWSADPRNVAAYVGAADYFMADVVGVPLAVAAAQVAPRDLVRDSDLYPPSALVD